MRHAMIAVEARALVGGAGDVVHATAPAMAATAPTERSMPRVAMTSVMPSAMSSIGAPLREDVDEAAVEVAVLDPDVERTPGSRRR